MRFIELQHLSVGYYGRKGISVTVVPDIHATLYAGRLTSLIGVNGVGKSTLLRTLAAFQPALSGRMLLFDEGKETGMPLEKLSNAERARIVSVVLTGKPDVSNLTVEELVALGRSPYTDFWGTLTAKDRAIVNRSMSLVGIDGLKERMVQTLSDGEQQKMMIAKALAQDTPVIILDEPTAFLDYPSKVELFKLLARLARETNKIIFLSTHDLELALHLSDEIWALQKDKTLTTNDAALLRKEKSAGDLLR